MELVQAVFYPAFVVAMAVAILLFIPRGQLRGLIPAAAVLGGLGDVITVWLFQDVLGIIWFMNHGIWECANQHFFSPIGWTLVMVFYFYFFPRHLRILRYLYTAAWAALAVGYGLLVRNVELYDFKPWFFPIPMYLTFLAWFTFAIWAYHALGAAHSPDEAER
ncbi:MAG: hypothetical protein GX195_10355 [Firmicutes bacterium]|nr:hypothetical protein [Bacillota bacterium]